MNMNETTKTKEILFASTGVIGEKFPVRKNKRQLFLILISQI